MTTTGVPLTALSNEVQLVTEVIRTSADLELTPVVPTATGSYLETVGPSACWQSGAFVPLADPVLSGGQVIDPTAVQDSSASSRYNLGEPLFLRLSDSDQNVDYMVIDYAQVTVDHPTSGDSETIQLSETGLDTGIFAGYLPTATGTVVTEDCVLQGLPDSLVNANYTDPADPADFVQSNAELDPINIVFDSQTLSTSFSIRRPDSR